MPSGATVIPDVLRPMPHGPTPCGLMPYEVKVATIHDIQHALGQNLFQISAIPGASCGGLWLFTHDPPQGEQLFDDLIHVLNHHCITRVRHIVLAQDVGQRSIPDREAARRLIIKKWCPQEEASGL